MAKFLILIDYHSWFLLSIEDLHNYSTMDVVRVRASLERYGHSVEVVKYADLDLSRSYRGYFVLYQSSEDIGVFYKDYIEDIIYYLEMQGAIPLPRYTYLLAHHNKNFMELLRSGFTDQSLKTIKSRLYGTGDEAMEQIKEFPVVLKSAEGSGSRTVFLARNRNELRRTVRDLSGVFIVNNLHTLKEYVIYRISGMLLHRVQSLYRFHTFYRKKFIAQTFLSGLQGDYKVLYFGGRYYAVYRTNRDQDFRASGSGRLSAVSDSVFPGLLDFARRLTQQVDFPIIGMDIGFDGTQFHLFEFQCIHVGPYALQASEYWHEYKNGKWVRFEGKSCLEEEFCRTINEYVHELESK